MKIHSLSLLSFLLLVGALLAACGGASATATPAAIQTDTLSAQSTVAPAQNAIAPASTDAPAQVANSSDGLTLLQQRCSICHDPMLVARFQGTADEWKMVVEAMMANGARLNSTEEQILVNYLAQTYHP